MVDEVRSTELEDFPYLETRLFYQIIIEVQSIDCKTAPSFARSPKIGVFERVLTRGREMGERGEKEYQFFSVHSPLHSVKHQLFVSQNPHGFETRARDLINVLVATPAPGFYMYTQE